MLVELICYLLFQISHLTCNRSKINFELRVFDRIYYKIKDFLVFSLDIYGPKHIK